METAGDLEEAARALYEAISSADVSAIERLSSSGNGVLVIGTDPAEWWDGHDRIMAAWEAQLKELRGVKVVSENLRGLKEGTVGWIADQVSFELPDGTTVPFRLTRSSTTRPENGRWCRHMPRSVLRTPRRWGSH
jgi:SnoaL-like domain